MPPILSVLPVLWLLLFLSSAFGGTSRPINAKTEGGTCQVKQAAGDSGERIYVLSNGLITAKVSAESGRLISLEDRDGNPYLKIGVLDCNWVDAGGKSVFSTPKDGEARIVTNDGNVVSVESLFTPKEDDIPCTVTIRYTVVEGVPGIYAETRFHHAANTPAFTLEQLRFCFFANADFALFGRTSVRHQRLPSIKALDESICMQPKEAMWMSNSVIDCKYDWALASAERGAYGVHSENRGLWLLEATQEYVNGGPEKQSLSLHPTRSPLAAPVLLAMFHSRHFQDGVLSMLKIPTAEEWSKTFGPVLLLVTKGPPEAQWEEAIKQQKLESEKWPYPWEPESHRGSVSGRVTTVGGAPLAGIQVLLADAVQAPVAPVECAQFVGKKAWFAATTNDEGNFQFEKVLPGDYTLYAWKDGLWESARRDGIVVPEGGGSIDALIFPESAPGRCLWQIGIPDRDGHEFFRGDGLRHFGRHLSYRKDFPDGLTFDVRKDNSRTQWNWAMLPVPQSSGTCKPSVWKVVFGGEENKAGRILLTVSLATSSSGPKPLIFRLNGTEIARLPLRSDTALWFGATRGNAQIYRFSADASLLRSDENTLSIENPNTDVFNGVVWDALKMERMP